MAFNSDIAEKWVLVIDDFEAMRSQLRMTLYSAGFTKLHVVSSIKDAMARIASNRYDLILCDYALGDGTDGQQFMEYLHSNELITRHTIFIMITAEQEYKKVVAASECAPDDYVLKPFTAAEFNARLEKLLERREYFSVIDNAIDLKNWAVVIALCDKKLTQKDKYLIDLCKIKCTALMHTNRAQESANLYKEILALRPIGWAKLGLARALLQLDKRDDAKKLAQEIMAESPQFMAAYDFLGKILAMSGEKNAALEVLQKAREVSPGSLSRVREMSYLAVSAGKPEMAEEIMRQALHIHKYSPVCHSTDYALLSKALVNMGKATEALSVLEEAQNIFKDDHSRIVLSAMESIAHVAVGNHEIAATALTKAMSFYDLNKLPACTVIELADACFVSGKGDDANNLLRYTIQNNPHDEVIKSRVHDALISAGKSASEAAAMIDASCTESIQVNNIGQPESVISMLCQPVKRLPINVDPFYAKLVANMVEQKLIVALEDIYAENNYKLVSKSSVISSSQWEKMLNHKLLKPIDHNLIINNVVTSMSVASDAASLTEKDHRLLQLISSSGDPAVLFRQLADLPLLPQMAFKLTVVKVQRPSLYQHLLLVTLISQFLANCSGLSEKERACLMYAALFHDFGELHIDPAGLNSNRELNDIEWSSIYEHPVVGYLIALDMQCFDPAVPLAILQHQERLDGSGYPSGLRGTQIGTLARIISIADVCASVITRDTGNERIINLMRLNKNKYDPKLISFLYRGFDHLANEVDLADVAVPPQLNEVARLMEKWNKFRATLSASGDNHPSENIEFLIERMVNLRSMFLQLGFDPNGLPQLVKLAAEDPVVAKELSEALCELNWQFKDLEREIIRRKEINNRSTLNFTENNLLTDWLQELHAYLAVTKKSAKKLHVNKNHQTTRPSWEARSGAEHPTTLPE